jgi:hypothetical protein
MAAPRVGQIINGYRYMGGDTADQANWQPSGIEEIAQAKAQGAALGKAGPPVVDQKAFNDAANQLKDVRGARNSVGFWNTGMLGSMATPHPDQTGKMGLFQHGIPGAPGYNLDKDLGTIRSRLMLQTMGAMKRQSPTGATGLGQLSNAEGDTLKTSVAALDTGLPAGQLRQNLDRVREDVIVNTPGLTYDTAYDLSRGQSRATIPRGAYYKDKDGNIRVNKNGDAGNPIVRPAPQVAAQGGVAPPQGVDAATWAHMTPQERALWN